MCIKRESVGGLPSGRVLKSERADIITETITSTVTDYSIQWSVTNPARQSKKLRSIQVAHWIVCRT